MRATTITKHFAICLPILLAVMSGTAMAQNVPSSDLLLPYFEVDAADPGGLTTLFAVGNSTETPVAVLGTVYTNWGIPILEVRFTLQSREVRTVNLRDWFRTGGNPAHPLSATEVQHLAAAASGQRSPRDGLYYASEIGPDLLVGYVTVRTQGNRPDALWGDWFNVDVAGNLARGDVLANIDPTTGCPGLCKRHLLRYLNGGAFDGGTEVIIWRATVGRPSADPEAGLKMTADATAFNEPGQPIENRQLALLPVEKVLVSGLGLREPFGSLDVESEEDTFIAVQHTSEGRYSVGLNTYCLPRKIHPGPGLEIVKFTNGQDANTAPGPSVPVGGPITWEYQVINTGNATLSHLIVTDDKGVAVTCPKTTLVSLESMTCTGHGVARACQYTNLGTVTGQTPAGDTLTDSDPSHYFGTTHPGIQIETAVNGQDADTPTGPQIPVGSAVTFSSVVTNTGDVALTGVHVSDSSGLILSCPKTVLQPAESMTCTAAGTARSGQFSSVGAAAGTGSCGDQVSDDDPVYYFGNQNPGLVIVKLTNGQDANAAPGPSLPVGNPITWEYRVTNTGNVTLSNLSVTDDKGVAVTCPKTTLVPSESMTCTGHGVAQACQYTNVGTVTGRTPGSQTLSASDPSHYFGATHPGIKIETAVNGQDADTPTGPQVPVGSALTFSSVVTNTGDVALTGVHVSDSSGLILSCPKTVLQPAESMTCTAAGIAQSGQFSSVGAATGTGSCGDQVSDDDPVYYFGNQNPGLRIVKLTNGQDANAAPGPSIPVGSPITWEYQVTNTGNVTLSNLNVTDDKGVAVTCPKTTLVPSESMTCTGHGVAQACQYTNVGTVTGRAPGSQTLNASDPSHYFGTTHPGIRIETAVDGQDADTPTGPQIPVGSAMTFSSVVTNTGDVALTGVHVSDTSGLILSCPKTVLQPAESMTCTAAGIAQSGQFSSVGAVTGTGACGEQVSDDDPVHYFGQPTGTQGCSHGYWKNHPDSWPATGYSTGQTVNSVFGQASLYPSIGSATLLGSLSFQGGSDVTGAASNLLKQATGSLLNSAHPGIDFPRQTAQLISDVNAALASLNSNTLLSLAAALDHDNNLPCPLN